MIKKISFEHLQCPEHGDQCPWQVTAIQRRNSRCGTSLSNSLSNQVKHLLGCTNDVCFLSVTA